MQECYTATRTSFAVFTRWTDMSINTGLAKKKKTQQRNGRSVTGKTKEKKKQPRDKARAEQQWKGVFEDKETKRVGGWDRQRLTIHYLSRLKLQKSVWPPPPSPSPGRAHSALTVMRATGRVTSCIYSIAAVMYRTKRLREIKTGEGGEMGIELWLRWDIKTEGCIRRGGGAEGKRKSRIYIVAIKHGV